MRIAVVGTKGLPPKQGGIEHHCAEIYPRIAQEGHSVDLFAQASYTGSSWFEQYNFRGVNVTVLPSLGINGVDTFVSSGLAALLARLKQYDVVHFHALGPGLFSAIPKLATHTKVVLTCHGLDWSREKWGPLSRNLIQLGERTAVRFADEIIVVSADLQRYFTQTYQRPTTLLPNAPAAYLASDPRFSFIKSLGVEPGRYIVFLGRLVPEKCPDLLIQAFQSLRQSNWKLVLVGGAGGSSAFTSKLYRLASYNPNVIFTGELRGSRLAEVVRGAGLFVLPSNLEGSPLALLEAMRERKSIIASDIAPHCELLNPDKGLLFKRGNLNSLTESIQWALSHPEHMNAMAEKAQVEIRLNYGWQRVVTEMLEIYGTPHPSVKRPLLDESVPQLVVPRLEDIVDEMKCNLSSMQSSVDPPQEIAEVGIASNFEE